MSDVNQDDIDKLLQDALVGGGSDGSAPAAGSGQDDRGPASQDDIDALFAAAGADDGDEKPAPAAPPPTLEVPVDDLEGVAGQDDIDALFAAVGGGADQPASSSESPAMVVDEDNIEPEDAVADQDDIDALFSAVGDADDATPADAVVVDDTADAGGTDEAESETDIVLDESEPSSPEDDAAMSSEDIDALLHEQLSPPQPEPEPEGDIGSELDELLSSIASDGAATPGTDDADAPVLPDHTGGNHETVRVDSVDMDELLRQVSEAAPPPPPPPAPKPKPVDDTSEPDDDTRAVDEPFRESDPGRHGALADTIIRPYPASPPPAPPTAPASPAAPAATGPRQEFSVLYGAGEVESMASQVSALISGLSEKAHGYMQAWIAADSEAKELRTRALAEERRRASLESERAALARELDELRSRVGNLEGGRVAVEEAKRTLETSFQAKIRELESQVTLLTSEAETLKNELTRARNEATGVDIESRRARFELDRLKNEVESERMERLRIQRALENREKELQAVQAQSSGQASSLFIDELHRLVRRLESELDARSSGAHEALKQLDRLETGEDMVPVVANLRASILQALGADDDQDDALKSLGREAAGLKGTGIVASSKAEVISFETALATYNLDGAMEAGAALLRDAKATPALLMRKVYQCPALRRTEVSAHLSPLARLLEGLRTVQEAGDRSRGSETMESEVFHVQMFDFLHNLVRLKIINRLTGDIWRLFLELRGRFSFIASDKQWAEYRDQTLNDKKSKA